MIDVDWMGLALPLSYVVVLLVSLYTFSTIHRKRKAARAANLAPWFPPHLQRNIYLTLLHMEPRQDQEKQTKVPEPLIRSALLRRAVEDIHRIIQIRTAKQACSSLLQRGSVGDDLWQRFLRAEKEMEDELRDVVMEANALGQNWGQIIFQSANEIAANTLLRQRLDEIQAQTDAEKTWWESRRATMEKELLGGEDSSTARTRSKSPAPTSPAPKSATSDEEAVLVDASTPAATTPTVPSPAIPASSKKKKGKK